MHEPSTMRIPRTCKHECSVLGSGIVCTDSGFYDSMNQNTEHQ